MIQTIKNQLTQTFVEVSEFLNSTETANTGNGH